MNFIYFQGRAIGIIIGCIIGMAPLYFISSPHKEENEEEHPEGEHRKEKHLKEHNKENFHKEEPRVKDNISWHTHKHNMLLIFRYNNKIASCGKLKIENNYKIIQFDFLFLSSNNKIKFEDWMDF